MGERTLPANPDGPDVLISIDALIRCCLRAEAARTHPPPGLAQRSVQRYLQQAGSGENTSPQ